MAKYQAAIGRETGKVDTDSGGLARYSLKLQCPPGIRPNAEPELSLEYCQGGPNSIVGAGWALGGMSAIRRAPSSLAYDGINPPPIDFDRFKSRLTLNGAELLNIRGDYEAVDAQYTTEVEGVRRIVMKNNGGFTVIDSSGYRENYGFTEDSRIGHPETREWRLTETVDYHGNTTTYTYVTAPRGSAAPVDSNTCYPARIQYTSNKRTGYKGVRVINFEYSARPDVLVQTVQGEKCTWTSRLSAVRFGVDLGQEIRVDRSYELDYVLSPETGDSMLSSVMETSGAGSNKVNLLPTTFGYTDNGLSKPEDFFRPILKGTRLESTTDNLALFPMNISGRGLADLLCVRVKSEGTQISIKSYLAEPASDGTVTWKASGGPGAEAFLPPMKLSAKFPDILSPDMHNSGRADFVVPYADNNNKIAFSISQCVGTGYKNAQPKKTTLDWIPGAKFMAMDLSGRGTIDIVQIFSIGQTLTLRNFPGINANGDIGLREAVTTKTQYEDKGTIDWFTLTHAGTGARSLVRIWEKEDGRGKVQLNATTFAAKLGTSSDGGFREVTTSLLGDPKPVAEKTRYTVLTCDINADGIQDVVLATALYTSGKMELTYTVYLGDGFGGFGKHGDTILQPIQCSPPLRASDYGEFSVTNTNGSNYPTLSYVYQERNSKAYTCLAVDGRGDATLTKPISYPLTQESPGTDMRVVSSDINGNGMGDWLLYKIENDQPRVVPVYNNASVTGFLSWAQDPMGLRTTLKYGCLSDPGVYKSGVDWKTYQNKGSDSYAVIAGPNYVVTQLHHQNDPSTNAFGYDVTIHKQYENARVNVLGRGWQGFELIHTRNATEGVWTTEKYLQNWPLTGAKCQVDTKAMDGQLWKSVVATYSASTSQLGPWKIQRSNKLSEWTNMVENGTVVRSAGVDYEYDESGNVTVQHSADKQLGQVATERWKRCAYTTIDGVSNVLIAEKVSGSGSNSDMTQYQPGDLTLTRYENDVSKAILKASLEWSSDTGSFSRKEFLLDEYGKLRTSTDAAGLTTTTTYDEVFKSFPVKVTEEGKGISSLKLTAFDQASGIEVARMEVTGLLSCSKVDGFGRVYETRARAASPGTRTVLAKDFLAQKAYVADASLVTLLESMHLDPQREIVVERGVSPAGAAFISAKVKAYARDDNTSSHEIIEYVDCLKRSRKRSSQDADDTEMLWMSWEYDGSGRTLFESFPKRVPISIGVDYIPEPRLGVRSTFDLLGRPTSHIRPAHGTQTGFIAASTVYLNGGATIQEKVLSTEDSGGTLTGAVQVSQTQRRYVAIGEDTLLAEVTDENGLTSTFAYDALGRVLKCVDAAGNTELRTYSSMGEISMLDNVYQNAVHAAGVAAITCANDAAGRLAKKTDATGISITYQRDAKGRLLSKTGQDGHTVQYSYDASGFENLAAVKIFPLGTAQPFESHFEFTYDHRARLKTRRLTLADGRSFTTTTEYDWQDREVTKTLPNGVVLSYEYRGSMMHSTRVTGTKSGWSVEAEVSKYSAFGKPETTKIQGSGIAQPFVHSWTYDSQGFPMTHSLQAGTKTLIEDNYTFNNVDQLVKKTDSISGKSTEYSYAGKRLAGSQSSNGTKNTYSYDVAGNIREKGAAVYEYSPQKASATKDGNVLFSVAYDNAGRMTSRKTEHSDLTCEYDSLGQLSSMKDAMTGVNTQIFSDAAGEMFFRRHADGSSELYLGPEISIQTFASGSVEAVVNLTDMPDGNSPGTLLASIKLDSKSEESKTAAEELNAVNLIFTDTKGSVTHLYRGSDTTLLTHFEYDDFGDIDATSRKEISNGDKQSTYEGKVLDGGTGLIFFGGRWYDPLAGRFTTPDDILDVASLSRCDGLNRYVFENNDPINHVDPTGHWSWSSILGVVIASTMIIAAVAITIATAGAAGVLVGMAVGALASGGVAGLQYSVAHRDEEDVGKFWGGFATAVAINAAIGAFAGGIGGYAATAKFASAGARIGCKILLGAASGGVSNVLAAAAQRGVDNIFYGTHHDLWEGATKNFLSGALIGGAVGAYGARKPNTGPNKLLGINKFDGAFKLRAFTGVRKILEPQPTNPWMVEETWKICGKAILKPGGKLASWGARELHLQDDLKRTGRNIASSIFS